MPLPGFNRRDGHHTHTHTPFAVRGAAVGVSVDMEGVDVSDDGEDDGEDSDVPLDFGRDYFRKS